VKKKEAMLAHDLLKELLTYNPETGVFTWKVYRADNAKAGDVAGSYDGGYGYIRISVNNSLYMAHRLAWLYMTGTWPAEEVDHINHIGDDNRWINLRAATHSDNQRNTSMNKNNVSGTKGVHFNKTTKRWHATIRAKGKRIFLGGFAEISDAVKARKAGEVEYGYHENHGK